MDSSSRIRFVQTSLRLAPAIPALGAVSLLNPIDAQMSNKLPAIIAPKVTLSCLQKHATKSNSEPVQSTPESPILTQILRSFATRSQKNVAISFTLSGCPSVCM